MVLSAIRSIVRRRRYAPPHHEGLGFRPGKRIHPEGPPKASLRTILCVTLRRMAAKRLVAPAFSSCERLLDGPDQLPPPTRSVTGLAIRQHTYHRTDDVLCKRRVENAYCQFVCSKVFFQHEFGVRVSVATTSSHRDTDNDSFRFVSLEINKPMTEHGPAKYLTAKRVRRPALQFPAGRRSGSHSAPPDRPLPCRDCRPRPSLSPGCALDRPHN
jgi:hypothetical protein